MVVITFRAAICLIAIAISIIGSVYIESPLYRGYEFDYDWIPVAVKGLTLGMLTLMGHILGYNRCLSVNGRVIELSPILSSSILILLLYIDGRSTNFMLLPIIAFENGFFWTVIIRSVPLRPRSQGASDRAALHSSPRP